MRTIAVPDGTKTVPVGTEPGPEQLELAVGFDLTTERGCYQYARELACRTVMALQAETLTKEAALHTLRGGRWRLGTFAEKLWKNLPVVIRADRLKRLELAYADARRSLARKYGT